MQIFGVLVVGGGKCGEAIGKKISGLFPECHINLANNTKKALRLLEGIHHSVVVSFFSLDDGACAGVKFLLRVKRAYPEVRTVLLVKNFVDDEPAIKLDTLELLQAVDCIWQEEPPWRKPHERKTLDAERIRESIGRLLQEKKRPRLVG